MSANVFTETPLSDIVSPIKLATILEVKPTTIYEWMRRKDLPDALPYFRVGRFLRFSLAEVNAWMVRQRKAGDPMAHIGGRKFGDPRLRKPRKTHRTKKVAA